MAIIIFTAGLFIGSILGALTMIFAQLNRSSNETMNREKPIDLIELVQEEKKTMLNAKEVTIVNHDV